MGLNVGAFVQAGLAMWGAAVASAWRLGGALCARHNCARGARAAAAHATAGVSVVAEAGRKVMLVESPTKAKKIQKYLGDEYKASAVPPSFCWVLYGCSRVYASWLTGEGLAAA